ncbi:MAG: hypothetical protein AAF386_14125, partial [Pseudomonadota bacterium]
PLLLPAILAGAVFTFVEGFDNLSVAIFTHGFNDRPLPIELLALVQHTSSPLVAAVGRDDIEQTCDRQQPCLGLASFAPGRN